MNLAKIDKFYIFFLAIMSLLAVMLVFTFKTLFSSFIIAYEVDQTEKAKETRIDKERLDKAYQFAFEKKDINLELR